MITDTLKITDNLAINVIDDKTGDFVGYLTNPGSGLTVMVSEHTLESLESKLAETWLNKQGIEIINGQLLLEVPSASMELFGRAVLVITPGAEHSYEVVYENDVTDDHKEVQTWFKLHPTVNDMKPGEVWEVTTQDILTGEHHTGYAIVDNRGIFQTELGAIHPKNPRVISSTRVRGLGSNE